MPLDSTQITVGMLQLEPAWLNRAATLAKVAEGISEAAAAGCSLVAVGEALVPGYPFWIEWTEGARFESDLQKDMATLYAEQAVVIEEGHLDQIQALAREHSISVVLGVIERAPDRGGHSLYCSRVFILETGEIGSVHRKLMPTYEERLFWSTGDGHGLQVHPVGSFTVGALNCWENWMPMARSALYALGENLHIAIWPGNVRNTQDITRFIALESRSFVLSVSGLLHRDHIPAELPIADSMRAQASDWLANGGSCLAGPDGEWLVEPIAHAEGLTTATIDLIEVRRARHNFDPVGHYSRPDVLQLQVDRRRQSCARFIDEDG